MAATSRASMSTVGPGGTGTTMVIGLAVGQPCAEAAVPAAAAHSANEIAAIARNAFVIVRCPQFRRCSIAARCRYGAGAYSGLMPAVRITFAHLSISPATKLAIAAGVPG